MPAGEMHVRSHKPASSPLITKVQLSAAPSLNRRPVSRHRIPRQIRFVLISADRTLHRRCISVRLSSPTSSGIAFFFTKAFTIDTVISIALAVAYARSNLPFRPASGYALICMAFCPTT